MTRPRRAATAALAIAVTMLAPGCATGGSADGSRPSRDPNRLTRVELAESSRLDLLSVIEQKRPRWLTVRTPMTFTSATVVAVVVDGLRQNGSAEVLRNIPAETVEEVRYLTASDATTQFGTDMAGGAIVVRTRR